MNQKIIVTDIEHIGDPFTLNYCGKLYIYATSASDGFKVFVADENDMSKVTEVGYCYRNCPWGINSYWAPEVIHHNGKFIMHYTCRWKETNTLRMSTAISDSPLGPFIDVQDTPIFEFGYAAIDGTCFVDDDGQGYFYFSRDCSENMIGEYHVSQTYGVKLTPDLTRPVGEPVLLSTPETEWEHKSGKWLWNEGPAMLKHNGKYYLSYSANCYKELEYSVCYSVSDSPLGKYEKAPENPILRYVENEFSGPGHNAYFKTDDGQMWTSFHIHSDYGKGGGDRKICFAKAYFDKDDKLVIDYK